MMLPNTNVDGGSCEKMFVIFMMGSIGFERRRSLIGLERRGGSFRVVPSSNRNTQTDKQGHRVECIRGAC